MVLRVLERGWSIAEAAMAAGVSERTCSKWVGRYRVEGEAGLLDRCSAPKSIPHRTPDELVEVIVLLRKLRMTGAEIAFCLALALSTVSAVLLRVDVKKLGRIAEGRAGHRVHGNRGLQRSPRKRDAAGRDRRLVGWEYVHVCVDDATRLAYVEVLPDEKALTAVGFLHRAVAFYARHAISVRAVMSDNGACYRSTIHAFACRSMGCDTSAPGPTGRAPTAKQSASSAPCPGAGPTARSTAQATNAPPRLTAGYGPTTIAAHTAPSATSPRSPASTN
jgi:transposase-like protein